MKFIVDAQLPKALCLFLVEKGHDCIHTLEMPRQNKSSDQEISEFSLKEKRILISKDVDFYNRYLIKLEPHKLIYLATGNISNKKLYGNYREQFAKNIGRNKLQSSDRNHKNFYHHHSIKNSSSSHEHTTGR